VALGVASSEHLCLHITTRKLFFNKLEGLSLSGVLLMQAALLREQPGTFRQVSLVGMHGALSK
jgi:hypothetical protein